jgi:hypothetical protein
VLPEDCASCQIKKGPLNSGLYIAAQSYFERGSVPKTIVLPCLIVKHKAWIPPFLGDPVLFFSIVKTSSFVTLNKLWLHPASI